MTACATAALALIVAIGAGCGSTEETEQTGLDGTLAVAGAGTSYPFVQAAAEQFQIEQPDLSITVARVPPDVGFGALCAGSIELVAAPRRISPRESRACAERGTAYNERRLPSDGAGDPVHLHRGPTSDAGSAFAGFIASHHERIAQAARPGRRALPR